jgi:hypothetical protein
LTTVGDLKVAYCFYLSLEKFGFKLEPVAESMYLTLLLQSNLGQDSPIAAAHRLYL